MKELLAPLLNRVEIFYSILKSLFCNSTSKKKNIHFLNVILRLDTDICFFFNKDHLYGLKKIQIIQRLLYILSSPSQQLLIFCGHFHKTETALYKQSCFREMGRPYKPNMVSLGRFSGEIQRVNTLQNMARRSLPSKLFDRPCSSLSLGIFFM